MVSLLNQITVHSRNGIRQSSIARSSVGWKYVQGVRQNHGNRSRIWTQKWTSDSKESPRNILGSHVYVAALILGFHSPPHMAVLFQAADPQENFHIGLVVHNHSRGTCSRGKSSQKFPHPVVCAQSFLRYLLKRQILRKKIHISLVVNNLSCVVFSPLQWAAQFKRGPACLHNWRTMLGLRSRQNIS